MNAEDRLSRRDELEALLPFYLNGTLEGADLAAVEDWLATDEAAMAALAEAEAEFSETAAANEAIRPPADALGRFAKALEAEAGPVRQPASSLLSQLWARVVGLPAGVAWAAAAAAVAFMLVQAVVEPGGRSGGMDDFEIAGIGDADLPFALVTFKGDARMEDVIGFLEENDASILAGPASGGLFRVAFPVETVEDYDKLVGLIAAQPFADTVIPGRKPANGS